MPNIRLFKSKLSVPAIFLLLAVTGFPLLAADPPSASCSAGVVKDDGDPEGGYGFVPNASEGIYLQKFDSAEFPRPQLKKVCLCFLKTRQEDQADFEVVFYQDVGGRPAAKPYATLPGKATGLARTKETAGRFYEVDVSGVVLPDGPSYIGARWDPSQSTFFFVCTDTSEVTSKVDVFFREDRMSGWAHVKQSKDPIFKPHRSILVRAEAASEDEVRTMKPRFVAGEASASPRVAPVN